MTVLVAHPTGNQNVRAVLHGLERHGLQPQFYTTIAFPPGLVRGFPLALISYHGLRRRTFGEIPYGQIRTIVLREFLRQAGKRFRFRRMIEHETGWASTDAVYHALDRRVARAVRRVRNGIRAVYAYEDGALASFQEARKLSVLRFYELPIAYWRALHAILAEERELRPEWAQTIDALRDSPEKCARKDGELASADCVIVPSRFVAQSLALAPRPLRRVEVVPYGAPQPNSLPCARRRPEAPLRILYAGQMAQHKGLAYLFEAVERFGHPYEFTLAGPLPLEPCPPLQRGLARRDCRWLGVVPHAKLLEEMPSYHVFVFPALAEGFGLVVTEALASGVPVIATTNTCAPEVIDNGAEGFVVPIRDPDAITEKLTFLYENEDRRYAMAEAAKRKAAAINWRIFEDRIASLVRELIP